MDSSTSLQPTPITPSLINSFNNYPWTKDRQFLVSRPPPFVTFPNLNSPSKV